MRWCDWGRKVNAMLINQKVMLDVVWRLHTIWDTYKLQMKIRSHSIVNKELIWLYQDLWGTSVSVQVCCQASPGLLAAHSAVRKSCRGAHVTEAHRREGDVDPPAKLDRVAQSCIQVCSNKLLSILKPMEQASQVRQSPPTVLWNLIEKHVLSDMLWCRTAWLSAEL